MSALQKVLLGIVSFNFCILVIGYLALSQKAFAQTTTPASSESKVCEFTKGDQSPKALPYHSQALLNMFDEVSQKTGVPAALLAGFARVEATTMQYTISNYTDDDVAKMSSNQNTTVATNVDAKIDGTKALCPVSEAAALGIMQVTPPKNIADAVIAQLKKTRPQCTDELLAAHTPCWSTPGGSPEEGIALGAQFMGKRAGSLTLQDYCDPKTSIYLAAGVILKKLQAKGFGDGTTWNSAWNANQNAFNAAATGYYGCLKYPSCDNGPYSYGDDIWQSFKSCGTNLNASTTIPTTTVSGTPSGGGSAESNEVITRVGNPSCLVGTALSSSLNQLSGNTSGFLVQADGKTEGKNETTQMPAYSVIKLWIAAAVLDASKNGRLNLNDTYTVEEKDKVLGTGTLQNNLPQTVSYDKLLELMLTVSDNTATTILTKKVGGIDGVNAYIKAAGYSQTVMERLIGDPNNQDRDNKTSAKDAVTFMQNLFAKKVVDEASSDKLIALLKKRTQTEDKQYQYLNRSLPTAADYTGKSGVGPNPITRNDAGSFLDKNGKRVYLAVFMTNQTDGPKAETQLAGFGQKLFDTTSANASTASCTTVAPGSNVHYCQGDPQWANRCAMAAAACGPTSMAMILTSFGDTILPPDMDAIFNQRGWRACGDAPSLMPTAIQTYLPERGYTYKSLSVPLNLAQAKQLLDEGYLIIGSVSIHIFVIDGVNQADNTVHLRDPARCGDAGVYWSSNTAPWTGASGTHYPWYYAYAVKKIASTTPISGVQ